MIPDNSGERESIFKKAKMPEGAHMLLMLNAAGVYDVSKRPTVGDRFYEIFVGLVENSAKNALELNYAWEKSANRLRESTPAYNKDIMDFVIAGLGLQFNAMMEAVVRDSVVMQEAIVFRRYSERRARQSKAK